MKLTLLTKSQHTREQNLRYINLLHPENWNSISWKTNRECNDGAKHRSGKLLWPTTTRVKTISPTCSTLVHCLGDWFLE